jgi:hypothetical protein
MEKHRRDRSARSQSGSPLPISGETWWYEKKDKSNLHGSKAVRLDKLIFPGEAINDKRQKFLETD